MTAPNSIFTFKLTLQRFAFDLLNRYTKDG